MQRSRLFFGSLLLLSAILLTGCADAFTVPGVAVSHDGQWLAFLTSEEFASRFSLKLLNVNSGEVVNVGEEGSQQGAFDWHPARTEIAYFNLSSDGVPSIQISSVDAPAEGISQLGALAFPSSFWVTEMAYAPDGEMLAMTALLLPDGAVIDQNQPFDPSQVTGVLYLADLNSGEVQIVSSSDVFATTLAWSPDGSKIAYSAWADDNQDNRINPVVDPAAGWTPGRDRFRVFVYEPASEQTSSINAPGAHYAPTWLDNNRLALVSVPEDTNPGALSTAVVAYDLTTQQTTTLIPPLDAHAIYSVSAAPDGSRLAYTTLPANVDFSGAAVASRVFVASADGSGVTEVYSADGARGVFDVPVWSPDGQTLYLSFSNPPSAQLTAFAEYDDSGATPTAQIIALNASDPASAQVIYEGTLASSALMRFNLRAE